MKHVLAFGGVCSLTLRLARQVCEQQRMSWFPGSAALPPVHGYKAHNKGQQCGDSAYHSLQLTVRSSAKCSSSCNYLALKDSIRIDLYSLQLHVMRRFVSIHVLVWSCAPIMDHVVF